MNMDSLNRWLTLTANIAVLIGIVFLAFELQQSNRIAIGTASMSLSELAQQANQRLSEPDAAGIIAKLGTLEVELTPAERIQAANLATQALNVWDAYERAYDNGLITEDTFDYNRANIRSVMTRNTEFARFIYRQAAATNQVAPEGSASETVRLILEIGDKLPERQE